MHRVASRLQDINKKLKSILERRQRYLVNPSQVTISNDNQRRWLLDGYPGRSVISVVGIGGGGKSTLAPRVYKNQISKEHFECYAWIVVSQKYVVEDILRRMIEEFYGSKNENVPVDLSSMRYKELLKVLVDYSSNEPCDAWDLFCLKAFSSNSCPEELQHTANELVRKCGGLPLALLALDAVMYAKKTSSEWIDFSSGLNQELRNSPGLEFAISLSKAEKFNVVYKGEGSDEEVSKAPRLSIQTTSKEIISITGLAKVRSLFMFSANLIPPSSAITLPTGLRLIRVLYLENVPIEKLSDEVGDLFNLSNLNLKGTKLKEQPKSIGRLSNLENLDIRDTKIDVVPDGIGKLQSLLAYHHNPNVDNFCFIIGIEFPSSICKLKSLKVFDCVTAEANFLKQLRYMTQLISFGITNVRKDDGKDLCISLQSLCLLHNLFVLVTDDEEYRGMDSPSFAPSGLETLLIEDLLPHIQALANLGELALINAYAGSKSCFSTGFNKLGHLYFRCLSQLDEIIIEKGVRPADEKSNKMSAEDLLELIREHPLPDV
ncbi:hypothetical protein RJ639_016339 [Escallonia herrerae]|uniref:NB-ARC domain-containing protein n=1 Tax=Escallonia herrerae TaxID=1293975 RepID=A0AA89AKK0_9ASTE|nr:hypothetical protein RJ639_016339 [Escallonia herrerae]